MPMRPLCVQAPTGSPLSRLLEVVPGWIKVFMTLAIALITATLAYAELKSDVKDVKSELRGAVNLLKQEDAHAARSLEEIKNMLEKEFERHHPRR